MSLGLEYWTLQVHNICGYSDDKWNHFKVVNKVLSPNYNIMFWMSISKKELYFSAFFNQNQSRDYRKIQIK